MGDGIYRTSLVMAQCPIRISLSTSVVSVKGNKEFVSSSFIATFSNGSQKVLNRKQWLPIGLRKEADKSEVPLFKETCSLFWKDWSIVPVFGSWENNFPEPIISVELASMLSRNSLLGLY